MSLSSLKHQRTDHYYQRVTRRLYDKEPVSEARQEHGEDDISFSFMLGVLALSLY
jgi:hypothetical protein